MILSIVALVSTIVFNLFILSMFRQTQKANAPRWDKFIGYLYLSASFLLTLVYTKGYYLIIQDPSNNAWVGATLFRPTIPYIFLLWIISMIANHHYRVLMKALETTADERKRTIDQYEESRREVERLVS